ncbi:uncharacterized protein AMSG_06596, partial [Thecamonas trahens ATCC 50062]
PRQHPLVVAPALDADDDLGLEFKALPAGSHTVSSDIVYFSIPPSLTSPSTRYGAAAYARREHPLVPRGAVTAAVGVIAPSYARLHLFLPFLVSSVQYHIDALLAVALAKVSSPSPPQELAQPALLDEPASAAPAPLIDFEPAEPGAPAASAKAAGKANAEDDSNSVSSAISEDTPPMDARPTPAATLASHQGEALAAQLEAYLATLLVDNADDAADGDEGASSSLQPISDPLGPLVSQQDQLTAVNPVARFENFVRYFGPSIFVLWKAMLLKKRILFFSRPPIEVVCFRVFFACLLAHHDIPMVFDMALNPLFYVSVADIDQLEQYAADRTPFVACTTEAIFAEKPALYDVYVNNQTVVLANPDTDAKALALTHADRARYRYLVRASNSGELGSMTDFVRRTNNTLLRDLNELATNRRGAAERAALHASLFPDELSLSPQDAPFVRAFCALHDIDIDVIGKAGLRCCGTLFGR